MVGHTLQLRTCKTLATSILLQKTQNAHTVIGCTCLSGFVKSEFSSICVVLQIYLIDIVHRLDHALICCQLVRCLEAANIYYDIAPGAYFLSFIAVPYCLLGAYLRKPVSQKKICQKSISKETAKQTNT